MTVLRTTIAENRRGRITALPSVCSAHPDVLRAALMQAESLDRPLIVEATSNQVNQYGGYTGMTPGDFLVYVEKIASEVGCDPDRLTFGGDHLGPQAWRTNPAEQAMAQARTLVKEYAAAGYTKIHLDCAEGCAGEPLHSTDAVCAARAAELARVAVEAAPEPDSLDFMVGTEVPPPGGAREEHHAVEPTSPEAARTTMQTHVEAFEELAKQIAGLVVQPGVEFASLGVDYLPAAPNPALRRVLDDFSGLCFEAHSTDYQHASAYPRLARMGFAVLKVGPALTFAYREAIYALDIIVDMIDGDARHDQSVRHAAETAMLAQPEYWRSHYPGDPQMQKIQRHFSYSDRLRYYWSQPVLQTAVAALTHRLDGETLPRPLLRQVFQENEIDRADDIRGARNLMDALIIAKIQSALAPYFVELQ